MADEAKTKWFCQKISELKSGMYTVSLGILKNEADAEDAIQNALIIAYEHLEQLHFSGSFKAWVYRILTNECYHILREQKDTVDIETVVCPAKQQDNYETNVTLWNAIQTMELNYRTVIILFYYENMGIREIAKTLNISVDNVKKRLSRARNQLKQLLDREDFYE